MDTSNAPPNDAPVGDIRKSPAVAELGHALRTPLTVVLGNVQLAARLAARLDEPDREPMVRLLAAAAHAAARMALELDRLDRLDAGSGREGRVGTVAADDEGAS